MVKRTTVTTTAIATTATTTTPIKKKKGRPSLLDLQNRALLQQHQQQQNQNPNNSINNNNSQSNTNNNNNNNNNHRVRSTRRILNLPAHFLDGSDSDDDILSGRNSIDSEPSDYDDDDDHDDDDERVQKKVKLVVQFPNKNAVISQKHQKNEKSSKATDNILNGTRRMLGGLEHGPTTTSTSTTTPSSTTRLPDKKLLLLLLDKLQKKDTRGVFAEPVDPEELPDYHEIIENPMDFETVRKKLIGGVYTILEQLEDDVNLICSNAMQYNAPSTIFFRQARAIQELAKKEFEVLKQDGGLIEAPNKPRRGRPPGSKNLKKILESSLPERSATVCESSPDATPASREEDPTKSGSYNLRKGPSLYRFPRSFDHSFDYSGFSASSSKWMSSKYGKKTFGSDENRRDTYFLSSEPNSSQDPHSLGTFGEKELTAQVGLALDHSYSRSLARFAADLGPTVWKIVSKKITSVLPPGVEFGPGWVGEPKLSSTQSNFVSQDFFQSEPHQPIASGFPRANFAANLPASCREKPVEPREFSSNQWSSLKGVNNDNGVVGPGSSVHFQHLNSVHRRMNGVSGSFGSSTQLHDTIARPTSSQSASSYNNPYALDSSTPFDASKNFNGMVSSESNLVTQGQGMPYWQNLSIQERWDHPYPVELNRGFQASSSKNSNLPIGSPPQLDLVLQL